MAAATGCLLGATRAAASLTEAARLRAIYDTILQAQSDRAVQELAQACPPAPVEACKALGVVAAWWRILLDPDSRALDDRFTRLAADAIAASETWTGREPRRAEAWFYLAGSSAPLVQWRVMRGERLAAAREGNRIRGALERALSLDPTIKDASFGVGLYHYYAAVAPVGARLLRALLLLPGGDRARGLREMLAAREEGELLRGEADYQLHWIYLWYERQPRRALELLEQLDARYPSNPIFLQRIAEVHRDYFRDHRASAAAWQELLDRALARRVEAASIAEVRARIGLGAEFVELSDPRRAIDHLEVVAAIGPRQPYGAHAIAEFELGVAYDRLGQHDRAASAYRRAIDFAPDDDPAGVRGRARAALRPRREAKPF